MNKKNRPEKPKSPARKNPVMQRFSNLVEKNELISMLEQKGEPKAHQLMELLLDPAYSRHSLARVCQRVGVGIHELVDWFRRHKIDEGILLMAKHMPSLMEDMAIDARSQNRPCPRCDGLKRLELEDGSSRDCPTCKAKGEVQIPGDKDARNAALQVWGLAGKKAAPVVAIQQNFDRREDSLEHLISVAEKVIQERTKRGRADTIPRPQPEVDEKSRTTG